MSQPDLIGTTEAAALLGWSRAKVKRAVQSGDLPYRTKLSGYSGAYLFDRAAIIRTRDQLIAIERARLDALQASEVAS